MAEPDMTSNSDMDQDVACYEDENCGPVCENECQQPGSYFNFDSCMCFYDAQCEIACPPGETLDPTEYCSCVPEGLIHDLMDTIGMWSDSGSVFGLSMAAASIATAALI